MTVQFVMVLVFVVMMLAALGKPALICGAILVGSGGLLGLIRSWWWYRHTGNWPERRDDDDDDWRNGPGGADWTGLPELPNLPPKVVEVPTSVPPEAPEEVRPPWRKAA